MRKTAIMLMMITIISKMLGFARDIALSYYFGASYITDAYLISITIPMVIFGFVGVGLSSGYIPMYSQITKGQDNGKGLSFTNNLVNILLVITTIVLIIGIVFTVPLVKLFASGFEGETLILAVKFSRISLVGMYFTGLVSIYNSFLQIKGNYIIPALVGFPMNIITILIIIVAANGNLIFLAIGSVIASSSQLLLVLLYSYKNDYKYSRKIDIKDEYIKRMIYIALPAIIGSSVNQINVLVDRTIASGIVEGGITALNYASRLNAFVQGIFVLSITTALFPVISKMAAENNKKDFIKTITESINSVTLLVIPATIGFMIFSQPIISVVFGRGEFTIEAQTLTSNALYYYSIGMLGFGLNDIFSRVFYALQDTKTPAIYSGVSVVINIILNIILSKIMGISGLALATSISAIMGSVLLFIKLRKKIGFFTTRKLIISSVKILAASVVMGIIAQFTYFIVLRQVGQIFALAISIGTGILIYFILVYLMKVEEVSVFVNMLVFKLKKIK